MKEIVKLKDITLNITDGTHSTIKDVADGRCFLLSCKNIKNGKIQIGDTERKIDEETLSKLKKRTNLQKDDVLITTVGTIGEMAMVEDDNPNYDFQRSVGIIKPDRSKVIPKYLYYALKNEMQQIFSLVKGAVQQCLFLGDIKEIEIELPSLAEQERIISLLVDIDKKIENNNNQNQNLEMQARTVFESWFVRFAPFNERMKETPIGFSIPESLELVQIEDIPHSLETGRRPKGGAVSEGIPSVGAESVKGLGNFNTNTTKYIPVDFAEKQKSGRVNGYELMIYKDGGKPGEFHPHFSVFGEGYPFKEFFINEHVFKLDFGNRGFNEFAYFYFQTDYVINWLESNGGKAAIPGINQSVVKSIWIYNPKHPKVQEYCEWVQPIFTHILKNCYSNMKLAELRDGLLPRLMSGAIDVSSMK